MKDKGRPRIHPSVDSKRVRADLGTCTRTVFSSLSSPAPHEAKPFNGGENVQHQHKPVGLKAGPTGTAPLKAREKTEGLPQHLRVDPNSREEETFQGAVNLTDPLNGPQSVKKPEGTKPTNGSEASVQLSSKSITEVSLGSLSVSNNENEGPLERVPSAQIEQKMLSNLLRSAHSETGRSQDIPPKLAEDVRLSKKPQRMDEVEPKKDSKSMRSIEFSTLKPSNSPYMHLRAS